MAEERQILLEIEVDKKGAQKQLEENAAQLEKNKLELKELNDNYKQGKVSVDQYAKEKLRLSTANKNLGAENRNLIKTLNTEDNSLNALRANLSRLVKERNNVNQQTTEGAKRFKQLQSQILDTTNAIKGQEEAGGDFRRSVGNYQTALTNNIPILGQFQQQLEGIKAAFIAQRAVTQASVKSLGVFRVALISTGIGAIVVALGSLIAFLATTQRGIDAVTKVTRPLQAIFQRLIGVVQDLGGDAFDALGDAIQNPIQALKDLGQLILDNIINRFKALQVFGEAISELFKGNFSDSAKLAADATIQLSTGITNATDKIMGAVDAVKEFANESIDAGSRIDALTKAIEIQEIALVKLQGTNRRIFEESKGFAQDQSQQIEDRIKSAETALQAQEELASAQIAQLNRRIELKKLENELNDTSREDLLELAKLEAERDEAAAQSATKRTEVNNLLNTLLKQQQQENTKLAEQGRIQRDQELEGVRQVNREIRKIDLETTQRKIDNIEREIEAEKLKNENIMMASANLAGALASNFKQTTAAYKIFASIEASIATYGAINKALNDPTIPSTVARIIQATAVGVKGFANVAKINGLFGGGGGGSTGGGSIQSAPRITRTTLDGSFDRNQLTSGANNAQADRNNVNNAIGNLPIPVVKVTDINKKQKQKTQINVSGSL